MKGKEMTQKRKKFSANLKAQVAMEAIKNNATTAELSVRYGVHPTQIQNWKTELQKHSDIIFMKTNLKVAEAEETRLAVLERKIGQLTIENDFLKKSLAGYYQKNG